MTRHERIKREIERAAKAIRAEMQALAEEFRRNIEAAVAKPGSHDAVQKKVADLVSTYERRVKDCTDRLDAELARHFPDRPRPHRGPYEEPRRRAHPINRRRLPKWPPDKRPSAGGVTVEPNRPNNLSGGAAAPLEFD